MQQNARNALKFKLFKIVFLSITMLALFGSSAHAAICPEAQELKWDEGDFHARVFTDSGWEGIETFNPFNENDQRKKIEFESAAMFTDDVSEPSRPDNAGVSCGYITPNESGRRNDIPRIMVYITPPNNPVGRIIGTASNWSKDYNPGTGEKLYRCSMQDKFSREECEYSLEPAVHVNASANPFALVRK